MIIWEGSWLSQNSSMENKLYKKMYRILVTTGATSFRKIRKTKPVGSKEKC